MQRYFLLQQPDVSVRDKKRAFTNEERHAIFVLSGKQCAECKKAFGDLSEMHADHELQWAHGGPTKLSNARGLCESCNQEAAKKVK
jgi:5-methylcytosine-specific restriction endonuclease McrA